MWQLALLRKLESIAERHDAIVGIRPFGSITDGRLDEWSDLDVELRVVWDRLAQVFPSTEWMGNLGEIYAVDTGKESGAEVTRIVFSDLRRLDLRMIPHDAIIESSSTTVPPVDPRAQIDQLRNEFLFESIKTITKIGRDDLLIGGHLVLGLEQKVLVLAMILRDRHFQTTVHRRGGQFNELALGVRGGGMHRHALLTRIAETANTFDRLARQLDPGFSQDWSPLHTYLERIQQDSRQP
jgi:hypothetical protein